MENYKIYATATFPNGIKIEISDKKPETLENSKQECTIVSVSTKDKKYYDFFFPEEELEIEILFQTACEVFGNVWKIGKTGYYWNITEENYFSLELKFSYLSCARIANAFANLFEDILGLNVNFEVRKEMAAKLISKD